MRQIFDVSGVDVILYSIFSCRAKPTALIKKEDTPK